MAQLGITVQEVAQRDPEPEPDLRHRPDRRASRRCPGTQQTFVVTAQGLLTKPEEFEDIIVRAAKEGTAIVRVRDIGRVELAKRDYSIAEPHERQDRRRPSRIYQQPGANAVETAHRGAQAAGGAEGVSSRPASTTGSRSTPASSR